MSDWKPGAQVDIPGFGSLDLEVLVTDYSGTLSCGGKMSPGVQEKLLALVELVDIHVLTSDTFGTVRAELANLPVEIEILAGDSHDVQKQDYVRSRCDPARVVALGNGVNDRLMLRAVADAGGLAVAVDNGEGCAIETLNGAHLFVRGAVNALDLLLYPNRVKASLRV